MGKLLVEVAERAAREKVRAKVKVEGVVEAVLVAGAAEADLVEDALEAVLVVNVAEAARRKTASVVREATGKVKREKKTSRAAVRVAGPIRNRLAAPPVVANR